MEEPKEYYVIVTLPVMHKEKADQIAQALQQTAEKMVLGNDYNPEVQTLAFVEEGRPFENGQSNPTN